MVKRDSELQWHRVCFQVEYVINKPLWWVDLILANEVVAPYLSIYTNRQIRLWRFHRRAADDKEKHKFSFIYYTSNRDAEHIYDGIASDDTLKALKKATLVLNSSYTQTGLKQIYEISDKEWLPAVREAWPYFAEGFSKAWLEIIKDLMLNKYAEPFREDKKPSVRYLSKAYKGVSDEMSQIWKKGSHPFLHHLSAIFAYETIHVPHMIGMRF